MTSQIFWPGTPDEGDESPDPTIQGFVLDYLSGGTLNPTRTASCGVKALTKSACSADWGEILQSVINGLPPARHRPVRIVHSGIATTFLMTRCSTGGTTVYKVLKENKQSWGVYCDETIGDIPVPHTALLMAKLWNPLLAGGNLHTMDTFKQQAQDGTLPKYSFLEPRWLKSLNSEHPTLNVCAGERFLLDIWNTVSTGRNWERTLLVGVFDEHEGRDDHVPRPWGPQSRTTRAIRVKRDSISSALGYAIQLFWSLPLSSPEMSFASLKGILPTITL